MTGFFPIMMFALPAAALAIWHTAKPAKRKATGALMISVALTAFITGITEPLEYAFAYVAFPIYAVHAVLTGSSLAIANLLGAKDGFAFSAGAIDYLLNFGKSAEKNGPSAETRCASLPMPSIRRIPIACSVASTTIIMREKACFPVATLRLTM